MESLNITIDGHLGMPGLARLRVPPPFGTSRDIIETIESRRAAALTEEVLAALRVGTQSNASIWRPRLTVIAIGVACTVLAAWLGSYTGKRHQLAPTAEQHLATAPAQPHKPMPAPVVSKQAAPSPMVSAAPTPTLPVAARVSKTVTATVQTEKAAVPPAKPTVARAIDRHVPHATRPVVAARPVTPAPIVDDSTSSSTYGTPTPAFVAPGTSVRIELQRHTRLTD
ncbi:hypothetical protein ACS7SF_15345 [Ralstonia sp. 25C]|uniref:hypothetical protein n=1 Tax=Ralstonia sp. 25C TaxID=3447363 RepID=UPI003F751F7E